MILSWRKKRAARRAAKKQNLEVTSNMELTIPSHFRCPISLELMKDPVTLSTGITYDRDSIEKWIEAGNSICPVTNQVLRSFEPVPNHALRMMIQDWCVEKRSYGIERIPTPRIPISSYEVSEILSGIQTAKDQQDAERCREMVLKIKELAKDSERNKRCISANGTGGVLAAAFKTFSKVPFEQNVELLEEILSALITISPLDGEAKSYLGSDSSLHCMVWFLKNGNLSGRRNSVLALIEIVSSDQRKIDELLEIGGAIEALVKLIKEPISPSTTKASLLLMYHIVSNPPSSANSKVIARLTEMELVKILLEMLVDCEKSICEKALGVLDEVCSYDEGMEKAYGNALSVPVLVKKLLRISDLATQFSVSILWKLCKNDKSEGGDVLVEALQLGAFQKLLLLLQVGSTDGTKEKTTELMKLMNVYRDRAECTDSLDFKNLKRSY
ncbi:U-box domain-containing protein 21-like [Coffea arabica]|uniref:U-box domain-containing protein n=1 Tax=Coffea arabica TaxID=13443 RepID=A0A6P6V640_COFAR|nr:U-box domain-containing protein 21-like [Coffea arabica]